MFTRPEFQEFYKLYLSFLIKCAGLLEEDVQAVAEQAHNSLCMIFDVKHGPSQRMIPFLGDIIDQFALYIKSVQIPQFFEMLFEFTRTYEKFIIENPEPFLNLIKLLVERGQEEYQTIKTGPQAEGNESILKVIWNTIRNIVEKPIFVENFQDTVEAILTPLVAHLETDDNLPFEDDILEYMVSVMKLRKEVTPLFWIIFKLFGKIFNKQGGMIWHLFQPLNQIIIHGKKTLNEDPDAINSLIKMLIEGLNPTSPKANAINVSEAATLLQLVIQYLVITNEQWEAIIQTTLEKVKNIQFDFLKAR